MNLEPSTAAPEVQRDFPCGDDIAESKESRRSSVVIYNEVQFSGCP